MKLKRGISLETMFDPGFKNASNLAAALDTDDVRLIGLEALDGYKRDVESRREWEKRNAAALDLALQIKEDKNTPWVGASNVKFPLITVAALQYQARAYPALINGNELFKCKVWGEDKNGEKRARADRIANHLSWQCLEQDPDWEEETDSLLLVQPITGNAFRKTVFDPTRGRIASKLVLPNNFVINYYTKSIAASPRYTETFYLTNNDIAQRKLDGRFSDIEVLPTVIGPQKNALDLSQDKRQGMVEQGAEKITPWFTGEQYCWLDLDQDGYEEPYIVTFDIGTGQVWRIVARFLPEGIKRRGNNIYEIEPVPIFQHYGLIPSPDGGFYHIGMGSLLGPINNSVNTALNQAFDSVTMKTLGGGFLGRGFKGQSGTMTFAPNTWFRLDTPGDDIRKSVYPLPVGEPPTILFQILSFLVGYAERIVSATDLQAGENVGQNTPAETARTMDTNGARVYSSIYKRTWRALKGEGKIRAYLNRLFLEEDRDYTFLTAGGDAAMVRSDDYDEIGLSITPAADPHVVSDSQSVEQAKLVAANSIQVPGHNRYQAFLRLYKALKIPDIERVMPQPVGQDGQPAADFPPPVDPKMIEAQRKMKETELYAQEVQVGVLKTVVQLQLEVKTAVVEIARMEAETIKLQAEAKGAELDPHIKMLYASIEAKNAHKDRVLKLIDTLLANMEKKDGATKSDGGAGVVRVETAPQDTGVPVPPARGNGQLAGSMGEAGI